MNELKRFIGLYRAKADHTLRFARTVPATFWNRPLPHLADSEVATIAKTMEHLLVAERLWFDQIASASCTEIAPPPRDNADTSTDDPTMLLSTYSEMVAATTATLSSLSDSRLETEVHFAGRRFTAMALCWTVFAHHVFHVGQIDLAMRYHDLRAVNFHPWGEPGQFLA